MRANACRLRRCARARASRRPTGAAHHFDGRYKFARTFASDNDNAPTTFEELVANNDLELYDLETDPDENTNLAADLVASRSLIDDLFPRLEALIAAEIGTDGKPT